MAERQRATGVVGAWAIGESVERTSHQPRAHPLARSRSQPLDDQRPAPLRRAPKLPSSAPHRTVVVPSPRRRSMPHVACLNPTGAPPQPHRCMRSRPPESAASACATSYDPAPGRLGRAPGRFRCAPTRAARSRTPAPARGPEKPRWALGYRRGGGAVAFGRSAIAPARPSARTRRRPRARAAR